MSAPTPTHAPSFTLSPLVLACLAATWLVWGSTYLAIKFALESFPPFWQMGTRFVAAGTLLAVWMRWRGAPWPSRKAWLHALAIGTLMLGGGMGMTAVAETSVASGLVVAFIGVSPMLAALFGLRWGVRPTRLEWAGIAVGLVGVVWLVRGAGFSASLGGLLAITTAVVCWSLGSVLSQRQWPLAPGAMGFASEMLCGGAVLLLMSWLAGETPSWPPTARAAAAWWYLVAFGSLIAFNAYMVLLARTSTTVATSYSFVNPLIAMLLGVAWGHEQVTPNEWLAAGVIIAGIVLALIGKQPASQFLDNDAADGVPRAK